MRSFKIALVVLLAALVLQSGTRAQSLPLSLFERYLDSLRQQYGIPGLSAVIVQQGQVEWERGFGLQDVEGSIAATPDTPYPVADLTQTLASVLAMQCVERGTLDLDEPIRKWAPEAPQGDDTVGQILAHASSDGRNGFNYDPSRYAALTTVLDGCGDQPYRTLLVDEILDRLAMFDSVPGQDLGEPQTASRQLFDQTHLERYAAVLERLASPYRLDAKGKPVRSQFEPQGLDAATGLIATARDLARFDRGLGDHIVLGPDSLALAWTNATFDGATLPSGLGWFVQDYNGQRLVWHFGLLPGSFSSLILKMPDRELTLILLANSDGLSESFALDRGDVTSSLFARLFLRFFA